MEKSIFDEAWAYAEEFVNPYQGDCDEPRNRRLPPRENHRQIYINEDVFDSIQLSEQVLDKRSPKFLPLLSNSDEAPLLPTEGRDEGGFLAKPA